MSEEWQKRLLWAESCNKSGTLRIGLDRLTCERDVISEEPSRAAPSRLSEAPVRLCPKCNMPMASAVTEAALYYRCRTPSCHGFFVKTFRTFYGEPIGASESATGLVEKSEKTQTLHAKLFPPAKREPLDLFPEDIKRMFKEPVDPSPSTEEVLEKSKTLLGVVRKMEKERQAEINKSIAHLKALVPIMKELSRKEKAAAELAEFERKKKLYHPEMK